jgi:hypothetical protein
MAAKRKLGKQGGRSIGAGYSVRKPIHSNFLCCRIWDPNKGPKGGSYEFSTGVRFEPGATPERAEEINQAASQRAAEIYARWLKERKEAPKATGPVTTGKMALKWLTSLRGIVSDPMIRTYSIHIEAHLAEAFPNLIDAKERKVKEYIAKRLVVVTRKSVCNELSCLRLLLRWAYENGHISSMPFIPVPPKRALGTAFARRCRVSADPMTPEEVTRIVEALPAGTKRLGPIRSRFILQSEMALRSATLDKLSVPEHWVPGSDTLTITADILKTRQPSKKPLTARAKMALEEAWVYREKKDGLLFGEHDYRAHIRQAAVEVLDPLRSARFAATHLRSAAISNFLDAGGSLPAAMILADHRLASTTDKYVRGRQAQLRDEFARQGRL